MSKEARKSIVAHLVQDGKRIMTMQSLTTAYTGSAPWLDGNDLTEELESWVDDGRHILAYRWRDTDQIIHIDAQTNEIIDFEIEDK